ncbi:unnamed protein product [Natator depressus]
MGPRRAAVPVRADPVRGDPPTSPRPKRIAHVELIPEGPHCGVQEVVVTRKDSEKVCLEPTAPWVKLIVTKILSRYLPWGCGCSCWASGQGPIGPALLHVLSRVKGAAD